MLEIVQEEVSLDVLFNPGRTAGQLRLPPSAAHIWRLNFQKFSSPSTSSDSSLCTATKLRWISRSFARASLMFFARASGLDVAPRWRWKMSFLESWVIARERMMIFSRRSFWRQLEGVRPT